ncbi:MAG: tetratricopeptide repeat protein [Cyclobacteriaceae bacterium]|nr:tetratricopeptide repeat protein [Cyclobacteriaceae bacterium]
MKTILLLLLFTVSNLLLVVNCKAQNPILDSLHRVLKLHKEDTSKVNTQNEISWEMSNIGNFDLALKYASDAILIAKNINYKKGMADSYSRLGRVYENQGNYSEALSNYSASSKLREEIGDNQGATNLYIAVGNILYGQGNYTEALRNYTVSLELNKKANNRAAIARSHTGIGVIYNQLGNYPEALENLFASLKIGEELKDKSQISSSYNNIGNVYDHQGNYTEALSSYYAALKIDEELGDEAGMSRLYNNIGLVYYNQRKYSEALENLFASLKLKEKLGNKAALVSTYNNIGNVYGRQGNYPDALKNYRAALTINEEIGNKDGIATSYGNIGIVNYQLKKYGDAYAYLRNALQLSVEIGAKHHIRDSYKGLSELDSATNNWRSAYHNHKMFIQYRDSLINEENTRKTVQTAMNYEFDKKEQATRFQQEKKDALAKQEMQKQKIVRNSLMGGFATVFLFLVVVYRQRNKVKKEKKRSDELLLNILPAEVAEELKETGAAMAKSFDRVTVLFTDFKGFTNISEQLSPQDLVKEIDYCFRAFDTIINKYGIEKIKTIGDSYMCAGGLPATNLTHPEDVVNAGIEIRDFMLTYKKERESKEAIAFEIRIGIHTGPVVAGIVGIKKFAYDIWGNTVNLASRMESSGEAGKINISQSTYELIKTKFRCEQRGKIIAKNLGEIDMYFVEA